MNRPIALRAAAEALANVGVTEESENDGKWIRIYQAACNPPLPPGSPWCAAWVVYRMRNAAHDQALTIPESWPRSGYCPDHKAWAVGAGRWVPVASAKSDPSRVRVGDQVLLYFPAAGRVAHTGLVVEVHPWGVSTVEGNTHAEGARGDDREGDGVFRRSRPWASIGSGGGFARMEW